MADDTMLGAYTERSSARWARIRSGARPNQKRHRAQHNALSSPPGSMAEAVRDLRFLARVCESMGGTNAALRLKTIADWLAQQEAHR